MAGKLRLVKSDGTEFKASISGNFTLYVDMLENKGNYIGKMATVKYQGFTEDGIPRFGVVKSIRDYE